MTRTKALMALGDELRAINQSRSEKLGRIANERDKIYQERVKREGKKLADKILESLPEGLRSAASKGDRSVVVALGESMRCFTDIEYAAAWKIQDWARSQGMKAEIEHWSPHGDDFYPANDKLWISW